MLVKVRASKVGRKGRRGETKTKTRIEGVETEIRMRTMTVVEKRRKRDEVIKRIVWITVVIKCKTSQNLAFKIINSTFIHRRHSSSSRLNLNPRRHLLNQWFHRLRSHSLPIRISNSLTRTLI